MNLQNPLFSLYSYVEKTRIFQYTDQFTQSKKVSKTASHQGTAYKIMYTSSASITISELLQVLFLIAFMEN